jgi:hypothetical protein
VVWFSVFYPDPLKYTDPDGRITEDEIEAGSAVLQNGATQNKLSDLVNINNLSEIIVNNVTELDDVTGAYIMGSAPTTEGRVAEVKRILSGVSVYSNVNAQALNSVVSQHANMPPIDGLSIGNDIYMAGSVSTMNADKADLLGHEAIHSIQAAAHGGRTSFMNVYLPELATNGYSQSNKFEFAAYAFGGNLRSPGIVLPFTQILRSNGTWWR